MSFLGLGTCAESLFGGNHLRMFRQDGPNANTDALFLAVSQEKDLKEHHTVDDDGYNKGRCVGLLVVLKSHMTSNVR